MLIPGTFGPENTYTNTAGVRQYEGDTNTGGRYIYTPQNNIDPNNPRTPNIAKVDDPSNVVTPQVGVVKDRTTSISETSNSATTQATIGEFIDYTVDVTLPKGTTFGTNAKITDTPNSAATQPIIGTPTATLNGAPLPAGLSINTVGQHDHREHPGQLRRAGRHRLGNPHRREDPGHQRRRQRAQPEPHQPGERHLDGQHEPHPQLEPGQHRRSSSR